jgi:hypothetical protein
MMKKKFVLFLLLTTLCLSDLYAQRADLNLGHPDRSANMDALPGFKNPPKGYGEVPFYWWIGDTLTKAHLTDHLNKLAIKGVSSLQVNYCHTDKGGKSWGLTFPSKPAIFTDGWWKLFGWFMNEAKKRGITVSLSDYTLGVGQEKNVDDVLKVHPELNGSELRMAKKAVSGGKVEWTLTQTPLSLMAYRLGADSCIIDASGVDLSSKVKDNVLQWKAPKGRWLITNVYAQRVVPSYDPMNPLSGKEYVKCFFQPFEDHFPAESKGGLNFFFSDELDFKLDGLLWDDYFRQGFLKRKGYDIVPHLAALFEKAGSLTPKYRLDYNDVMVSLTEENYFKVVYQWHEDRGLIFGCDHNSRGKNVVEFGDYIRAHRWIQAAGCDQPGLARDIIKNKVASSIAHIYNHPRTWLEGFYGSGWNTSSAMLLDALYANYAEGQNLLSLHGLYYTTLGGWWEWAPPGNHFHEPYWEEMPHLLGMMERLSYLLSQGHHCADVVMIYPTEPVVAGDGNNAVQCAFKLGENLYSKGIDFDFIDYESLARAVVKDRSLNIAGEKYSVLIIPSMTTIRSASLQKAMEFQRAGGIVLAVDELPRATELGVMDAKLTAADNELQHCSSAEVIDDIKSHIHLDFKTPTANPYIMHRRIGFRDVYAVYNVAKGTECYFRTKGSIELWDPWTGNTSALTALRTDDNGTYISMPLDATEMQLIVFDPSKQAEIAEAKKEEKTTLLTLDGEWNTEVVPCLDNQWGDFTWPGTPEKMGPEIRSIRFSQNMEKGWNGKDFDDSKWSSSSMSFGNHYLFSGAVAQPLDEAKLACAEIPDSWKPYAFSWRWGVENDYGHQGYHGLKGEMYDDFIRLGKIQVEGTGMRRVDDPAGSHYYLLTKVIAPSDGTYSWMSDAKKPASAYLNGQKMDLNSHSVSLKKGANTLLLHYEGAGTTYFVFTNPSLNGKMVSQTLAERPLSMKWNGDLSVLPMDITPECDKAYYRFVAAPGLQRLTFTAFGKNVKVWVDGKANACSLVSEREDGAMSYEVKLRQTQQKASTVAIGMETTNTNMKQAAAFPYAIKEYCGTGLMKLGDWADCEGLKYYSGGMNYKKSFTLQKIDPSTAYQIDLGDVVSTAELWLNGMRVGLRMCAPWTFDVTPYLKAGKNELSVIVYNTAHNQYLSIPTRYNAPQKSGILGPVKLIAYKR